MALSMSFEKIDILPGESGCIPIRNPRQTIVSVTVEILDHRHHLFRQIHLEGYLRHHSWMLSP